MKTNGLAGFPSALLAVLQGSAAFGDEFSSSEFGKTKATVLRRILENGVPRTDFLWDMGKVHMGALLRCPRSAMIHSWTGDKSHKPGQGNSYSTDTVVWIKILPDLRLLWSVSFSLRKGGSMVRSHLVWWNKQQGQKRKRVWEHGPTYLHIEEGENSNLVSQHSLCPVVIHSSDHSQDFILKLPEPTMCTSTRTCTQQKREQETH